MRPGGCWVPLGSFTRVRAEGRWVHLGSLGSHGCAFGVDGSIRNRCVHSGDPWGSLGSSGVVAFARVRPEGV